MPPIASSRLIRFTQWTLFAAVVSCACGAGILQSIAGVVEYIAPIVWPAPPVIQPGTAGGPPSDAIVLFDGKDMSAWKNGQDWIVKDGYVISHGHDIDTKRAFGDCQIHVEWASPEKVTGHSQGRGNSGVYIMGLYEVQILDSYDNDTYYDGQAGSVYKQHPPMTHSAGVFTMSR